MLKELNQLVMRNVQYKMAKGRVRCGAHERMPTQHVEEDPRFDSQHQGKKLKLLLVCWGCSFMAECLPSQTSFPSAFKRKTSTMN